MSISARIVADSISPDGVRLTTMQLRYPRFVHAEFMTHRVFSRNASSSRAIPVERMIADVEEDVAQPVSWGSNQPGMQAGEPLTGRDLKAVKMLWLKAARFSAEIAQEMHDARAHKQIVNRILEPFGHISVIVTATEWENFFLLRCHPAADPTMCYLAETMQSAMVNSVPQPLKYGEWHLPYVTDEEIGLAHVLGSFDMKDLLAISVARCARVSYLNHDGSNPDPKKDLALADKLLTSGHMSPFEHQAAPDCRNHHLGWDHKELHGNFRAWRQWRKFVELKRGLNGWAAA